jgi:hypothetical protein
MNSMWFNVEHYHNTHSTHYTCTHYTLLSTAWCFQSVCNSVIPWCVILFSTNSSPLVHPPVHFPPVPHQSRHHPQGLSREMRTVLATHEGLCHRQTEDALWLVTSDPPQKYLQGLSKKSFFLSKLKIKKGLLHLNSIRQCFWNFR